MLEPVTDLDPALLGAILGFGLIGAIILAGIVNVARLLWARKGWKQLGAELELLGGDKSSPKAKRPTLAGRHRGIDVELYVQKKSRELPMRNNHGMRMSGLTRRNKKKLPFYYTVLEARIPEGWPDDVRLESRGLLARWLPFGSSASMGPAVGDGSLNELYDIDGEISVPVQNLLADDEVHQALEELIDEFHRVQIDGDSIQARRLGRLAGPSTVRDRLETLVDATRTIESALEDQPDPQDSPAAA